MVKRKNLNGSKEGTTMKKTFSKIHMLAALLVAGAAFAACSSSDDTMEQQPAKPTTDYQQGYTMTIKATKMGEEDATRGLTLDGNTLKTKWTEGEEVKVMQWNGTSNEVLGTLTAGASSNNQTTLTGTLSKAPSTDEFLKFYLHDTKTDYTGQTGVLTDTENSIEKKYDYALTVLSKNEYIIDETNKTVSLNQDKLLNGLPLSSQQAIVKFVLKDKYTKNAIKATKFTIKATYSNGTNDLDNIVTNVDYLGGEYNRDELVITPDGQNNEFFVALHEYAYMKSNYTLTAEDAGGHKWICTKQGVNFNSGNYYVVTLNMEPDILAVNLGLSVRWAGMNIGAANESDCGYYFAWGDTEGKGADGTFSWDNYKWGTQSP